MNHPGLYARCPYNLNHFTFSVRQDLEDGYYGEEGEEEYEDGEPYAKAANLELSLGTHQVMRFNTN